MKRDAGTDVWKFWGYYNSEGVRLGDVAAKQRVEKSHAEWLSFIYRQWAETQARHDQRVLNNARNGFIGGMDVAFLYLLFGGSQMAGEAFEEATFLPMLPVVGQIQDGYSIYKNGLTVETTLSLLPYDKFAKVGSPASRWLVSGKADEVLEFGGGGQKLIASGGGSDVLFGQVRIGANFSRKKGVPSYLSGRSILEVAEDLKSGVLHPDQLPINAFEYEGKLVTINNRTLGTLSLAGKKPTIINVTAPTNDEFERLFGFTIINSSLPGPRIPVTPSMKDHFILYEITIP